MKRAKYGWHSTAEERLVFYLGVKWYEQQVNEKYFNRVIPGALNVERLAW